MAPVASRSRRDPLGSWGRPARGGIDRRPGPRVGALAPDDAVRARLNAGLLDTVLVAAPVLAASTRVAGASWSAGHLLAPGRLVLALAVALVYSTVCELAWAATVGKRIFGVRVVALEGGAATRLQIVVRNMLRVLDVLPLLYAVGLVSMARSGATRRQRLGDLAAGTTVMLAGARRPLRTPRGLLAAAVLASLALSAAAVLAR